MNLENKKMLTEDIIKTTLESQCGFKQNMTVSVVWFLCAAFVFCLFVLCLMSFIFAAIPLAVLCGWLIYTAVKRIKKGKANAQEIQNGNYKVIESVCTRISEPRHCETEDGKEYYTCDVYFANGVKWFLSIDKLDEIMFKVGQPAYLLYLDSIQKPLWVFGSDYYLA